MPTYVESSGITISVYYEETEEHRIAREAREADVQAAKETTVTKKSKSGIISGITRGIPNTNTYREPAIVTYYYTQAGFGSAKEMADAFVKDYNDMIESVEKYKGFYVGRYEISGNVENPTVKYGKDILNCVNWYQHYKACREFAESSTTSTMMWGCQWDIMCKWTQKSGDKVSYFTVHSNRHTGRNYVEKSGTNSYDKSNNIYDIEGNCYEWTQETFGTNQRAFRGGFYRQSDS